MINICKKELDWLDMTINIKKSMCMRIGRQFNTMTSDIDLNNKVINQPTGKSTVEIKVRVFSL